MRLPYHRRGSRLRRLFALAASFAAIASIGINNSFGKEPLSNAPLYYSLGGKAAASPPATIATRLNLFDADTGLDGAVCGGFDQADDVTEMLSSSLNETMAALNVFPNNIVSSLPGYILCRAQPGLCQILQHYVVRAEDSWTNAIQTCENDLRSISGNGGAFRDWVQVSKVQNWEHQVASGATATEAKQATDATDGCVTWVGGVTAGCVGHDPIWPTQDAVRAGWCLLQNESGNCQSAPVSPHIANQYGLQSIWPNPNVASDWIAEVVGDHEVHVGSKPSAMAGVGLLPKIEEESTKLQEYLYSIVYSGQDANANSLSDLGTKQVRVSSDVIDALRDLPDRDYLINRLANEIALTRVIDKAFLARRLMLTGLMEPNIQAAGVATEPLHRSIELLEREIERAMYETQLSRRLVSDTAIRILSAYRSLTTPEAPSQSRPSGILR